MLLMDRVNTMSPVWSHVISDAPTAEAQIMELDAFRKRVRAPASALQRDAKSWLHLDLRGGPRAWALRLLEAEGKVFPGTAELVEHLTTHRVPRAPRRAIP